MYVLNHIEDTVWLRATAYNDCNLHLGDSIEPRRYWFVCSFYGIDEDNPSTGAEAFDLDISPNPNNGEMSIHFGEMEGLVNATVYDMQGQTVDRFSLEAIPKSRHSYTLKDKKSGIYLIVFNYNEHLISKKIIIKN